MYCSEGLWLQDAAGGHCAIDVQAGKWILVFAKLFSVG